MTMNDTADRRQKDMVDAAREVSQLYARRQPLERDGKCFLLPDDFLKNQGLSFYGQLAVLPVIVSRDPESPMALAAAVRLGQHMYAQDPRTREIAEGLCRMIQKEEIPARPQVKEVTNLLMAARGRKETIVAARQGVAQAIFTKRRIYNDRLMNLLRRYQDGALSDAGFLAAFFDITTRGNMKREVQRQLMGTLVSGRGFSIDLRLGILDYFDRMAQTTKNHLITTIKALPPTDEAKQKLMQKAADIVSKERLTAAP